MAALITREDQLGPFVNEPFVDFGTPQNRARMEAALARVGSELGREYGCYVDGAWISGARTFESINPSHQSQVVGRVPEGDPALCDRAVDAALRAFASWKDVPAPERCDYFFRAAQLLRERKFEMSAWMVHEVGKNWAEADADTAETVDFLDYYCRQMLRLDRPPELTKVPEEENRMLYIPLGVGVAIPPWNFPCAILAGLVVSAAVAGNTVVLKPSENSPIVAVQFMKLLEEVGLPKGVVNMVTGPGPVLGSHLVAHPSVRFVSFTGSMEVGCRINETAARVMPGQLWLKRVIAEMGGKNATVVAEDADVDAAAIGTVQGAFGFQGQKCSASSRAIVVADVYDRFLEKVVAAAKALKVGPTEDPATQVGPVISPIAYERVLRYIDIGKTEGRLVTGGEKAPGDGFYVAPTVFADVKPGARIAQEEIFGPVLAVIRAKDFDEALAIANGTKFGLTGAVYSGSQARLDRAAREFHVGNLYLNRKCTGAMVGRHPFGGFNMSGTDSKTGGPDYLLQFTQAKSIAVKKG